MVAFFVQKDIRIFAECLSWVVILSSVGCAQGPRVKELSADAPVRLELKAAAGQEDVTKYYSHSRVVAQDEGQVVKEKDEVVLFAVKEKVTNVDDQKGRLAVQTTTIHKDGTVDLHDLAFPELNEEIVFEFSRRGQVFRAGGYPPESIFFVPPIPLPEGEVKVGDTWTLNHAWIGLKSGIPMGLQLVTIFKRLVQCGPGRCADLEVSGDVQIAGAPALRGQFASQISGRMLFSIERGAVVWADVRSREVMAMQNGRVNVVSCMASALTEPSEWRWTAIQELKCEPEFVAAKKIPGI